MYIEPMRLVFHTWMPQVPRLVSTLALADMALDMVLDMALDMVLDMVIKAMTVELGESNQREVLGCE